MPAAPPAPSSFPTPGLFPLVFASFLATGCATVPSGDRALVITPLGTEQTLDEGSSLIFPFSRVDYFDMRAQERNEDLIGLTSDGASVIARSSLVTYHILPSGISEVDHTLGPHYYEVLIKPLIDSTVRKVFASYRWLDLDSDHIVEAQERITRIVADRLRRSAIALDGVQMRQVMITLPEAYAEVVDTEVWKQKVLERKEQIQVARGRADALRNAAVGTAESHRLIEPTLSSQVISDSGRRAWGELMRSRNSSVKVMDADVPSLVEVRP